MAGACHAGRLPYVGCGWACGKAGGWNGWVGCQEGWFPKLCCCGHTGAAEGCCHAGRGEEPGACHDPCWPGHDPFGDVTPSGYSATGHLDRFCEPIGQPTWSDDATTVVQARIDVDAIASCVQ